MIINLYDSTFAHDKFSVAGKQSKYIQYDRDHKDDSNLSLYTHEQMYLHKPLNKERSFGWLFESVGVIPDIYRNILKVADNFKQVFTYFSPLITAFPEVFRFAPAGGIWIGGTYGLGEIEIYEKSKNISMVSSFKKLTYGHKFRCELASKLLNSASCVDVYGFDRWVPIIETLRDYRFSIVIENIFTENYFTEKLMNCFATGTIPVYFGCTNIDKFFNKEGIIVFDDKTDFQKLLNSLSEELYFSKVKAMKENFELCKKYEILEDYLYSNYFAQF